MNKLRKKLKYIQDHTQECSTIRAFGIFTDYLFTKLILRFSLEEYMQYQMYRLRYNAKKEYISEYDVLHRIPEKINNSPKREIFNNKNQFNDIFRKYLGRTFCVMDGNNYEEFSAFAKNLDSVIIKPLDSWCGHGVEKIHLQGKDLKTLYDTICHQNGRCLAEEVIQQHKDISAFNSDSVNTLRVITLQNSKGEVSVPCAAIRIGRKGSSIDNFCAGGMAAVIDPKEGIVITGAYDKDDVRYVRHPDSGLVIVGFQIPYWDHVVSTVKEAARLVPEIRLVGWDVVVKQDGDVSLIEGNISPGARTIQMPIREGLHKVYTDILGEF